MFLKKHFEYNIRKILYEINKRLILSHFIEYMQQYRSFLRTIINVFYTHIHRVIHSFW